MSLTRRTILGATAALATLPARAQGAGLLAKLQAAKSVKVGIANQPPYSAIGPDGQVTGHAPTVARTIMQRLGVPAMEGSIGSYGELIPGMQAGRWDFVAASLTISKARCGQVLFADPLVIEGSAIVWLKSSGNKPLASLHELAQLDVVMGVQSGGADLRNTLAAGVSPSNIRQFTSDPSIVDGLLAGRMQYAVMSHAPMVALIAQRNLDLGITYPVPDIPVLGSSCAFRQQDTDLHGAFQTELRKMKASGEFAAIGRQFGFEMPPEFLGITSEQQCSAA